MSTKLEVADFSQIAYQHEITRLTNACKKSDDQIQKLNNIVASLVANQAAMKQQMQAQQSVLKYLFGTTLCKTLKSSYYYLFNKEYYFKLYDQKYQKILQHHITQEAV